MCVGMLREATGCSPCLVRCCGSVAHALALPASAQPGGALSLPTGFSPALQPCPSCPRSLWSLIKDMVGKDLTRVCLPVYFNEPLSALQARAAVLSCLLLLVAEGGWNDCSCVGGP